MPIINDVIDDLILHAWKGQFDSLITLFCVLCVVLKVNVLLTSLMNSLVAVFRIQNRLASVCPSTASGVCPASTDKIVTSQVPSQTNSFWKISEMHVVKIA